MTIDEIISLHEQKDYPSVSILIPTHRTFPENQQDQIRVKNKVNEAIERLISDVGSRGANGIVDNLKKLEAEINYKHAKSGLALFSNNLTARKYYLPFEVSERVIIDHTFATRDLLFSYNRSPKYFVLALSEKPTRFFSGHGKEISEIKTDGFPAFYNDGIDMPLPGGRGINKSSYRDETMKQFFRGVDKFVNPFLKENNSPLVLLGIERNISFYNEVTSHKDRIIGERHGSYDKSTESEIAGLIKDVVKEGFRKQREKVIASIDVYEGAKKLGRGLDECWRLNKEGRIETLIVEEDYHTSARKSEDGLGLEIVDKHDSPEILEDAVDELIEMVLLKKGSVIFTDKGKLEKYGKIVALLRY